MFVEGEEVIYKEIKGTIAFVSDSCVSILISKGEHRSHDVKVVVHSSDYINIESVDSK